MGFDGFSRHIIALSGAFAVLGATGCLAADPTTPCASRSFDVEIAPLVTDSDRVLAIGNPGGGVTVLSHRCTLEQVEDGDCAPGAELVENYVPLPLDATVDQLLTSANGRWLVVRTEAQLRIIDLENPQEVEGSKQFTPIVGPSDAEQLVGTLRSGSWVIFRSPNGLAAYDVANNERVAISQPGDGFFVAALGDRHLVVRRPAAGGGEELYMLTVDPYRALDSTRAEEPTFLTRTPGRFTQVVITRGRTPNDDTHPTDHRIVATATGGEHGPSTLVFDAHSGEPVDQFSGKVITSRSDHTSVEGLSAATPDGKAVAYITPNKSVALHDLDGGGSCLVRSHKAGDHGLAGFSADGVLFFESFEYDRESNSQHNRVYSFNPRSLRTDALTPGDESHSLKAVPPGMLGLGNVDNPNDKLAWAVSFSGDTRWAIQPNEDPQAVTADDATYLTRSTAQGSGGAQNLMMVQARPGEDGTYSYAVGRITARPAGRVDGEYRADFMDTSDPDVCLETFGHDCYEEPVTATGYTGVSFHKQAQVCVSTARASGWARDCFKQADRQYNLSPSLLGSEDPYN